MALFVALGGTAYAVNTVGSSDIIDGQVKSVDVGDNEIGSADVKDNSLNTFDVHSFLGVDVVDGTLTGADIGNFSLTDADVATNTLTGAVIANDTLSGADINESTLVGVKDGCHAGAVLFGRLCAGSDGALRTPGAAFNFCASIGLRLPSWGEAVLLGINSDVPGVALGEFFQTAEVESFTSATVFATLGVDEAGNTEDFSDDTALRTVCVETPTDL
jgi:hypothetical protein